MPDLPTQSTASPDPDRTVLAITDGPGGWMVYGTVRGVDYSTPTPLTPTAAGDHLRVILPDLFVGGRVHARRVALDPDDVNACRGLFDALYTETGVDIDPAAIRDALRILARGSRS